MGVGRGWRRELRRDKKEVLSQEEVRKEVPMHGGAGLSVGLVPSDKPGVIRAGEPAVGINA
eukprot:9451173-Prorocentrum_lima.AAC.1